MGLHVFELIPLYEFHQGLFDLDRPSTHEATSRDDFSHQSRARRVGPETSVLFCSPVRVGDNKRCDASSADAAKDKSNHRDAVDVLPTHTGVQHHFIYFADIVTLIDGTARQDLKHLKPCLVAALLEVRQDRLVCADSTPRLAGRLFEDHRHDGLFGVPLSRRRVALQPRHLGAERSATKLLVRCVCVCRGVAHRPYINVAHEVPIRAWTHSGLPHRSPHARRNHSVWTCSQRLRPREVLFRRWRRSSGGARTSRPHLAVVVPQSPRPCPRRAWPSSPSRPNRLRPFN